MVSSNASLSPSTIIASATPAQTLFFQLYKHRDNNIAAEKVREVEKLGFRAIWLTVDAVVVGNRERDIKSPWEAMKLEGGVGDGPDEADLDGTAGALLKNDDLDMSWKEVGFRRQSHCLTSIYFRLFRRFRGFAA
jgi:L-lactate dehydrogenase (cytochrome)